MSAGAAGPPARCSADELRGLFLFEKLTGEQLAWLCHEGRVLVAEPGPVYTEGDPATCFYVLLDGTLVLSRRGGFARLRMGSTATQVAQYAHCAVLILPADERD